MAFSSPFSEEDITCPVCCDTFNDPVVLSCSHSFCKSCVKECWKMNVYRECPVCRRRSSKTDPPCNRALKNLCESFLERQVQQRPAVVCMQHNEKLQLFCLEDKQTICLVCQASKTHRSHNFVPIDEAALDHKNELQTALVPLNEKLKAFNEMKQICEKTADHIKNQVQQTEREIKKEFERLHQFLRKEQATRIANLKEEEKRKSLTMKNNIVKMNKLISSLSDTIRTIEKELRAEHIPLLENFEATIVRAKCTLPNPQLVSDALMDEAKHLGNMSFRVWEKMREIVKHTPVILDPNTAHTCLCLTDDLTGVRCTQQELSLPNNPERCTFYADVRGSEGFRSGKHSWEVEVGSHPYWFVGAVKKSADRKVEIERIPGCGIWEFGLIAGKYVAAGKNITVKTRPQKIRVQLDYDGGEMSFYDPKDMTLLYVYKDTFAERIYPLFSVGMAGNYKRDLQICQSEVSDGSRLNRQAETYAFY
ncbi:hypothetical protein DPEC_G00292540 [Dallia pectoralis]|uniref:Uncharacterized protein n=1 Tax=Dallia pectoralis TaxID=75939 RepID=A0ACC2FHY2_DALPE|nr:hypothetical protein DPEC_G00292540 [Dallia pectoralis]